MAKCETVPRPAHSIRVGLSVPDLGRTDGVAKEVGSVLRLCRLMCGKPTAFRGIYSCRRSADILSASVRSTLLLRPKALKLRTVVRASRSGGQHATPAGLPRRGPRDVRAPRPSLSGHQAAQAAHPARAERCEDFVTANPGARNNGHSRQRKLLACVLQYAQTNSLRYCDSPTRRATSWNLGSDRKPSHAGSVLIQMNPSSRFS